MNKEIGFWAMVVIFGVIGLLYTSLKPDSYTEHQQLILEQFEHPEDVQFVYFKSGYEGTANVRGRNEFAVATVQLTKA